MFDVFDPVGSWFTQILTYTANASTWMFGEVMKWTSRQAQMDFEATYFLNAYKYTLAMAFFIGLPLILIKHFVDVKNRREGHSALWDVLFKRVPLFVGLSIFGVSIGIVIAQGIAKLNTSIIDYMMDMTAEELTDTYTNLIVSAMLNQQVPIFVALLAGLLVLCSIITLYVFTLLISVGAQVLGMFFPLAMLANVTHGFRGLTRKFIGLLGVVFAATPMQLLLLGFFVAMLADNADALTVSGAASSEFAGDSALTGIGLLVVSALVFLLPVMAPLGLLQMLGNGGMPSGGSGSSSGTGGSGDNSGGGISGPQQAAARSSNGPLGGAASGGGGGMAPAQPVGSMTTAGVGGSASATSGASGGAGATGAGASAGAGTSAGTAAAAGAAGAATAGVGAAVVMGLSAAGRMATAARAESNQRMQSSVQAATMAAIHLEHQDEG